jgi:hypothetical protein
MRKGYPQIKKKKSQINSKNVMEKFILLTEFAIFILQIKVIL